MTAVRHRGIEPLPLSPALTLVSGAGALTRGVMTAGGILFVVCLIAGILLEEVLELPPVYDAAFRASLGMVLIGVIGGALLELGRHLLESAMRFRAAERRFEVQGAPALPAMEDRRLRSAPYGGLFVAAMFALVLGPCTAAADLFTGMEFDGIALVVGLAVTAAGILLIRFAMRADKAWGVRASRLPASRPSPETTPAGTTRWAVAGGVALQLGVYAFFGGVVLRKPCRECDVRSFGDSPLEGLIDVLVGAGALLVVVPLGLLMATALPALVRTWLRERRVLRDAAAGTLTAVDEEAGEMLVEPGALERLGFGSIVVGSLATMVGGTSWLAPVNERATAEDIDALTGLLPLIGSGLTAVGAGLVVAVAGVAETRRRRLAIHRALPGFDRVSPIRSDAD